VPLILSRTRLLHVSKSKVALVRNWEEGVSLERDAARTVSEVLCVVAADRLRLGVEHRRQADHLMTLSPPLYRSSVSRYYYAMYHVMRACAFIFHRGDDYEDHRELPKNLPTDFDRGVNWQNKLKDARTIRNSADYDPYPKADTSWRKPALVLKSDVDRLLPVARTYLRSKGCIL